MATTAELAAHKSNELQHALDLAGLDGEVIGGDFRLVPATHPVTKEYGFVLGTADPGIADADVLIVKHDDTGVVQFVFQVQGAQPMPANKAIVGVDMRGFGFVRSRQLAPTIADPEKWTVKAALKIGHRIATEAIRDIARVVEKKNKTERFIALADGYDRPVTAEQWKHAQGKRVLVFVHGIFSSIEGAFSDLGAATGDTAMAALVKAYDGNVFGYDHWTISKTPLQNAIDLLDAIPAGADWSVDLVCHSRGGLITRSLLAAPAADDALATAGLGDVVARRKGKIKDVGKAVFVAAANQGSPLADPDELRNFLNVAAFLASKSPCFALGLVVGLVRAVVSAAFDLPSVRQLASQSDLIEDLNSIGSLLSDDNAYGAHADFAHAHSKLLEAGVLLDKLLMRTDNDLVVPYEGVVGPRPLIAGNRLVEYGTPQKKQGVVWHTTFFEQPKVQELLTTQLTG
jgi:hypothetical protein